MPAYSGHQGVIKMDVTAGATATTDISSGVTAFSFSVTRAIGTHHTLGSDWQQATVGGTSATFSISARVDSGATSAHSYLTTAATAATTEASRTFELFIPANSTGAIKWTGEGYVAGGANVSASAGDGAAQVATFDVTTDGTWTKSAVT